MSPDPTTAAFPSHEPGDLEGLPPDPIPELQDLARLLSEHRQAQGLSLPDLAQRLHMGLEQLKALEQGDPQHLPEPVFVIAQARRVADALGIEISAQIEALRASSAFMAVRPALKADVFQAAATRQRQDQAQPHQAAQQKPKPHQHPLQASKAKPAGSGSAPRLLAWLLLLAGLGSGGVWVWQQRQWAQPVWGMAARQFQRLVPQAPRPAPVALRAQPRHRLPVVQAAELQLSANQPSWLEVRPLGAGAPLFRGRFVGERRFPLGQGLRVRAGRPDLVLVAQGSTPARPLGTISEIRWVSFRSLATPPAAALKPAAVPDATGAGVGQPDRPRSPQS